ncbi:MAG: ATP-binding protein [Desulfobacteraceae bacterium]|nr:ATP-binding protein [Desulfobacteraceae bacterium]
MNIGRLKEHLRGHGPLDKNLDFLCIKSALFLQRHIDGSGINEEVLHLAFRIIGNRCYCLAELLLSSMRPDAKEEFQSELEDMDLGDLSDQRLENFPVLPKVQINKPRQIDHTLTKLLHQARRKVPLTQLSERDLADFTQIVFRMFKKAPFKMKRCFRKALERFLEESIKQRALRRKCALERAIDYLSRIFDFNPSEREFLIFAFLVSNHGPSEELFNSELHCQEYSGRPFLANLLGITTASLVECIEKFRQLGLISFLNDGEFMMDSEIAQFLQNCQGKPLARHFFQRVDSKCVPLSDHLGLQNQIQYVAQLLKSEREAPVHILFYGPPGTGKTSLARGMASKIKMPAYEVAYDEDNESKTRRTALMACLQMARRGRKSLVIVDEADNLLNTQGAWFSRGETQDKGWLNRVLEEPGARALWITNRIEDIEDSVLRRFCFSIEFQPFHRHQRVQLWGNILRNHQTADLLRDSEIQRLAKTYRASAGDIDLAVKTAKESFGRKKGEFLKALQMLLEANQTLHHQGRSMIKSQFMEEGDYSIEGLNVDYALTELKSRLKTFHDHLQSTPDRRSNLNLLFYGPPGTGKSALARHLADHLDREVICKRMSDLQSMWLGEGEKNIAKAFEEAEREDAILVIDEADSVLFSRDRSIRSWEISFTNEFLTRMEHHRGILICTTNRLSDLDDASLRRFRFKIRFDYLDSHGNVIFYQKLLGGLVPSPLDETSFSALKRIQNLAPGDFKIVRDRYSFNASPDLSHQMLIADLTQEASIKNLHGKLRQVGFR